jgi:hypothetical protein
MRQCPGWQSAANIRKQLVHRGGRLIRHTSLCLTPIVLSGLSFLIGEDSAGHALSSQKCQVVAWSFSHQMEKSTHESTLLIRLLLWGAGQGICHQLLFLCGQSWQVHD